MAAFSFFLLFSPDLAFFFHDGKSSISSLTKIPNLLWWCKFRKIEVLCKTWDVSAHSVFFCRALVYPQHHQQLQLLHWATLHRFNWFILNETEEAATVGTWIQCVTATLRCSFAFCSYKAPRTLFFVCYLFLPRKLQFFSPQMFFIFLFQLGLKMVLWGFHAICFWAVQNIQHNTPNEIHLNIF